MVLIVEFRLISAIAFHELRWWLLGKVDARILLVRYTHRPNGIIRLIGAGYWREGRDYYENHWKNQTL